MKMIEVFWNFISENYLGFLIIGVFLFFLMYVAIGNASGLFWKFLLEGILTILIGAFLLFVMVYLLIGF